MNKLVRRFATALLAVLLLLQAGAVLALADGETYQVRIYAGNVGATINGGSVAVMTAAYGENIAFDASWVQLPEDSPYYVRGIRKSGLDNNTVSNNVIHVTEDLDYVVAYGIKGKLVAYTVSYVDEEGNQLAPSQIYYGNAGDKPVVAYLYIEGYQPQAYNLTKTLSENEAQNRFPFIYTPVVRPTPPPSATPGPTITPAPSFTPAPAVEQDENEPETEPEQTPAPEDEATAEPTPVAGEETQPSPENEPEAEVTPEAESTAEPEVTAEPETEPDVTPEPETEPETQTEVTPEPEVQATNEPRETIDLDEEEEGAPLGDLPEIEEQKPSELQKDREQKQTKFYVAAAMLGVALIAIVATVIVLVNKRRKRT